MSDSLSPWEDGTTSTSPGGPPKIRRRNRIITSCLECRRRKLKCDRSHPCNHCSKARRDCVFLAPSLDANSKNKLNQFKESVDSLEKDLGRQYDNGVFDDWNIATSSTGDNTSGQYAPTSVRPTVRPKEEGPADERGLEATPLAVTDIVYDDDNDDFIDDLGVKLGKMRVTERIGGFVRPKFADELSVSMGLNPDLEAPSYVLEPPVGSPFSPPSEDSQSWLEPSDDYLAPGLGLAFPSSQTEEMSLLTFLPSKDFADKLLERYWISVDPLAKTMHRQSFERQYAQFWDEVSAGFEPSSPLQALIFAMQFSASVSMLGEQTQSIFGCPRTEMIRTFRMGCEFALSKSNLLRTTKTITIQAFIMYLVPLCRSEVSRAHASLVSMAIRLAECAGFHRDGSHFGLSAVDTHVRRLLWYQLCFLDVRICEAVGPRPTIRTDEFDVKVPLNVNDSELESFLTPTEDAARFTDSTLTRLKIESSELSRAIWRERPRVERGETTLAALLRLLEAHKERVQSKYMPVLNKSVPVQAFAALFIQFATSRTSIGVLNRYVVSTANTPPERLLRIVWANGARTLEASMEWDTSPVFRPLFSWYLGAWQQWHVALLFVPLIVTMKQPQPELARVWRVLDYVFEFDSNLTSVEKMKLAFGVARKRLEELQNQRKAKLPIALEQRLGKSSSENATSDRKPSATAQAPVRSSMSPLVSDSSQSHAQYGFPDSNDQSANTQTDGRSGNFEYTSHSGGQVNERGSFKSMARQPSPNMQYESMPTSTDPSQFGGVNWGEDFESLFPFDDSTMSGQQYWNPVNSNDVSSFPDISNGQAWTLLPGPPPWERQQQKQQQPRQPEQQPWSF